ncbi:hypothetical protein UFOVP1451_3 [uncultured Caudovirales phage]|uniref:Uncharacterized protein n=1 Tax=uncultured Caudovirales phage TaxID=2100421 RepID=A0A6J5SGT2_9CAUD|nr:hypothetical protein UFOVP1451_3 [uncultured Caudovirales phage]
MEIATVKDLGNRYQVNETIFVPKEGGRQKDIEAVREWIAAGGIVDPEFSLAEIKAKKIADIKAIRDTKNVETLVDTQASTLDAEGNPTGNSSYFVFYTSRHPTNPAADPSGILTGAMLLNQTIPYSTKSPSGEKITVAITPEIARSLSVHIALRNNNNYKLSDAIEAAVKAATSQEEIEAITWNVSYLGE